MWGPRPYLRVDRTVIREPTVPRLQLISWEFFEKFFLTAFYEEKDNFDPKIVDIDEWDLKLASDLFTVCAF